MDKEQEILSLKGKLKTNAEQIRGELEKIEALKTKLAKGYRHRDKKKYEEERRTIMEDLKKYEDEMKAIKEKLSELEEKK